MCGPTHIMSTWMNFFYGIADEQSFMMVHSIDCKRPLFSSKTVGKNPRKVSVWASLWDGRARDKRWCEPVHVHLLINNAFTSSSNRVPITVLQATRDRGIVMFTVMSYALTVTFLEFFRRERLLATHNGSFRSHHLNKSHCDVRNLCLLIIARLIAE